MSDTSATRVIRKEDVERNTPGNPVEIPYVQIQEESTERGLIGIKLPNGTKLSVTEIHRTANKELFLMHSIAANRSLHDLGLTPKAKKCESMIDDKKSFDAYERKLSAGAGARCPRGPS